MIKKIDVCNLKFELNFFYLYLKLKILNLLSPFFIISKKDVENL